MTTVPATSTGEAKEGAAASAPQATPVPTPPAAPVVAAAAAAPAPQPAPQAATVHLHVPPAPIIVPPAAAPVTPRPSSAVAAETAGNAQKHSVETNGRIADLTRELEAAQARTKDAERRAADAEKAFHDLAGQKAVEAMAARRKIEDLEAVIKAMGSLKTETAAQLTAEIEAAEKRVSSLRAQLARVNAV